MTKENVRFGINIFVLLKYSVFYDVTAVRIGKNLLPFRMQHSPSGKKISITNRQSVIALKTWIFKGQRKLNVKKRDREWVERNSETNKTYFCPALISSQKPYSRSGTWRHHSN